MSNVQNLYRTETLEQLLLRCRAQSRPNIQGIWNDIFIFLDLPKQEQLIEITGQANTGKTLILLEIMARCILPIQYGGKQCEVIFFDCDHKFSMLCFLKIMEKKILSATCTSITDIDDNAIKNVVENSLKLLKIYNCYSSDDLELALIHTATYIFNNNNVGLLCVDSLCSFYWDYCSEFQQDNRFLKMDTYYQKMFDSMKKICEKYKLNSAFTIPNYCSNKIKLLGDYSFHLTRDKTETLIEIKIKDFEVNYKKSMCYSSNRINIR